MRQPTRLQFTVTAQDQFNNTATGYAGTVHFTSSDGNATLPADSTLTNGVGTFNATLKTAGNQTITATDTVTNSITGTSNTITVSGGGDALQRQRPGQRDRGHGLQLYRDGTGPVQQHGHRLPAPCTSPAPTAPARLPGQQHADQRHRHLQRHAEDGGQPDYTATDTAEHTITGT